METPSLDQALSRLGSAVARLERNLDKAMFEAAPHDPDLANRHEALRQSVGATLSELDRLIGSLER